jgi:hypothetical protein
MNCFAALSRQNEFRRTQLRNGTDLPLLRDGIGKVVCMASHGFAPAFDDHPAAASRQCCAGVDGDL